jgi:phosphatidylglycerophosphate synthase
MANPRPTKNIAHERPLGYEGDWSLVAPEKRTRLQRIAAKTKGWLTVGNLVSLAGAGLTVKGIYDYTQGHAVAAIVEVGAGRTLDLVDGAVATWTKTRGLAGAFVDSGIDKALAVIGLSTLTLTGDLDPRITVPAVFLQAWITKKNKDIHDLGGNPTPKKLGKYAMAGLSLYYASPIAAAAAENVGIPQAETILQVGGIIGITSVVLSAIAAYQYHNDARDARTPED